MTIQFDNIIFSLQKLGGISNVWKNLISPYVDSGHFIVNKKSKSILDLPKIDQSRVTVSHLPVVIDRYLDVDIQRDRGHVFHSSYYRTPKDKSIKTVVTLHDMMYELFGGPSSVGRFLHVNMKKKALRQANVIVCISLNTKADLIRIYPEMSDKRIEVIPNGVEKEIQPKKVKNLPSLYFVYVGSRGYAKNFETIFKVLEEFRELNCVAITPPLTKEEKKNFKKRQEFKRIKFISFIKNEELAYIYSNASFCLCPSLYEGFGLTALEAMKYRTPVVAAQTSSLIELVKDYGYTYKFNDTQSMRAAVKDGIAASEGSLDRAYDWANTFSWDRTVQQYRLLYEDLEN